jgi:hypothetical protein
LQERFIYPKNIIIITMNVKKEILKILAWYALPIVVTIVLTAVVPNGPELPDPPLPPT